MCAGYRALVCFIGVWVYNCQMDEAKRPALPERRNTETGFPSLGSPSSSTATCAGCAKAVIGECLHALGKSWHPACFKCQGCSISYVHRRTVLGAVSGNDWRSWRRLGVRHARKQVQTRSQVC